MALPICIKIEPKVPLEISLPGGVSMQHLNLMEVLQPALTPLAPLFNIVDTVVALFNCVKAIPDALGPPPDPTVLTACFPELAEKIGGLLKLIPQLSLPYTIVGIIDIVVATLRDVVSRLRHLQTQMRQIAAAVERAQELEDTGLKAVIRCAEKNIELEAANVGASLAAMEQLFGILNIFLSMIGGPKMPDITKLSGLPLNDAVAPIEDLVEVLQQVRAAVPLP